MGSRSTDTLKDIEAIRARVDARLEELATRMPPAVKTGKAIVGVLGGSGALLVARKVLFRSKVSKKLARRGSTSLTVKLLPTGTLPVALGIAGIWASVKFKQMQHVDSSELAVVSPLKSTRTG